jgi:hypothetical protein
MKQRPVLALAGLVVIGCLLVAWLALPWVVDHLPGPISARLPEPILAAIHTPLPTALPAPVQSRAGPRPTIVLPEVVATMTPTPSGAAATRPATSGPGQTISRPPTVTPLPSPTATATPRPLPPSARIENVNIIAQKFNNCGPANLSMVLRYFDHPIDQLDIGAVVKPDYDDRNVSPGELVAYVLDHTDLEARAFAGGDVEMLQGLIAADIPVIIEKGLAPSEYQGWMGHYLTLIGYDRPQELFYALDTFLGPWDGSSRAEDFDFIREYWQHFNYTFVVVYRTDQTETVAGILGPEMLDPGQMWQRAAVQAQADIDQEPDNAFAWFNLGTSLTELGLISGGQDGSYENAATAYDQAREIGLPWRMLWYQFNPYVAYLAASRLDEVLLLTASMLNSGGGQYVEETYLYRGHALVATGDPAGARVAYRAALRLNPGFTAAAEALAALDRL